ncbi:hypothetical protein KUTeg_005899, partial [Tegillarca granosa]
MNEQKFSYRAIKVQKGQQRKGFLTVEPFNNAINSSQLSLVLNMIFASRKKKWCARVNRALNRTLDIKLTVGAFDLGTPSLSAQQDAVAPFNTVTTKLIGDDTGPQYFNYDTVTGAVSVRQDLRLDTNTFYRLRIEAKDGGTPALSATALVEITVQRNLFTPSFTNLTYETTILETQAIGTTVIRLLATDQDSNRPHNVTSFAMFSAQVSDLGVPSLTNTQQLASVVINVIRNQNPPFFFNTPYETTINRTTFQNTQVFQVSARDNDLQAPYNTISYAIIGDDTANIFFNIDNNGLIRLSQSVAGESTPLYTVRVLATDGGSPSRSATATVKINIRRNLFAPAWVNQNLETTIPETTSPGSQVLTVQARDNDISAPENQFRYSWNSVNNFNNQFFLDSSSGQISYRVTATDLGSPALTSVPVTVVINIRRNRFPPVFQNEPYSRALGANVQIGTSVVTVTATDADTFSPFNVVSYSIIGDDNAQNLFSVAGNGVITLTSSINTDSNNVYRLRVVASDGGNPSLTDTTIVYVNVTRNLLPPQFQPTQYSVAISETRALATAITAVTAVDNDLTAPNNVVRYTLAGNAKALEFFTVGSSSGQVSLIKPIYDDPDNTSVYQLTVTAMDMGFPALSAINTATVSVSIFRNRFAPEFLSQPYFAVVTRETNTGTQIYTVTVTDRDTQLRLLARDGGYPSLTATAILNITVQRNLFPPVFSHSDITAPNNVIRYSAIGDADAPNYFYVNPIDGRVTLLNSVLNTGRSGYSIIISRTTETLGFILPAYTNRISENLAVGQPVTTVTAQPQTLSYVWMKNRAILTEGSLNTPDIVYDIIGFSDGPDYFNISSVTGSIFVRQDLRLDLNKKTLYYLQVRARKTFSNGEQTATTQVNITVTRNENTPFFSTQVYETTVPETLALGSSVIQLLATDQDAFDVVVYEVIPRAGVTDKFYLSPSSGLISLRTVLTSDTTFRYNFTVKARDQSSPEKSSFATVIVNVRRSSFPPVFIRTPYQANVDTNTAVGTQFYTVTATDSDLLGSIRYEVNGYFSAPAYFSVNPSSGEIIVLNSLLSDVALNYVLGVKAYDTSVPSQVTYANVTINVNRNPSAPVFTPQTYSRTVPEDYALDTGLLTLARTLTSITTNQFQITVSVTDNGIPPRVCTFPAQVTIQVLRNQFDPFFLNEPYVTTIPETTNIGVNVLQVTARDQDTGTSFNNITYQLIGDDTMPSYFALNTLTGQITVRSVLTAETRDSYQGRIVAFDSGSPPRSATATAKIFITRNLNKPVFNPTNYAETILETLSIGTSILRVTATDADRIFNVYGTDQGSPNQISDIPASVTINIIRNQNPPVFVQEPYSTSISFTVPSNTFVYDVNATDADTRAPFNEIRYSIIGDDRAPQLFNIDQFTGVIRTSSQSLITDSNTAYTIRVVATDGGNPSRSDTSSVLAPYNTLVFNLIGQNTAGEFFEVNSGSGFIYVKKSLTLAPLNTYV